VIFTKILYWECDHFAKPSPAHQTLTLHTLQRLPKHPGAYSTKWFHLPWCNGYISRWQRQDLWSSHFEAGFLGAGDFMENLWESLVMWSYSSNVVARSGWKTYLTLQIFAVIRAERAVYFHVWEVITNSHGPESGCAHKSFHHKIYYEKYNIYLKFFLRKNIIISRSDWSYNHQSFHFEQYIMVFLLNLNQDMCV